MREMSIGKKPRQTKALILVSLLVADIALNGCARSSPVMTPLVSNVPFQVSDTTVLPTAIATTAVPRPTATRVCPEVEGLPPAEAEGSLVMLSTSGGVYVIDLPSMGFLLKPGPSGAFVDSPLGFPLASPDSHLLGFVERVEGTAAVPEARRLRIIDATGRDVIEPRVDARFGSVTGWTNAGQLTITDITSSDATTIVLDPFTGVESPLRPSLPDLDVYDPIEWYALGAPVVVYDQGLGRLVYFAYDEFVLWDVVTGHAVATQETVWPETLPMWSPDGSQVVVVISSSADPRHEELVLLGRNGPATELTHLDRVFSSEWIHLASTSWSPEGGHIAFWIGLQESADEYPQWRLAIIDVESGAITNYCLSQGWGSPPIWSPDGRFLALRNGAILDTELQSAFAIDVGEHVDPIGWLRGP